MHLCISCRASEPKRQKYESAQKVWFPLILERVPKSAEKCGKPHFLRKKCAKSAVCHTFWHSFWNWRKTPLFVQINVFAVWALRLDRK